MKTAVVSYSITGNNDALAARVAGELGAEHFRVTEERKRTKGMIAADLVFRRTPRTQPGPNVLPPFELIIFVGPVWMGKAATPLRSYLKYLKKYPKPYAFLSISGGALNDNPDLAGDLRKRAGAKPAALVDLHIVDLLPPEPKPTPQDTSAYCLTGEDLEKLAERILGSLREKFPAL